MAGNRYIPTIFTALDTNGAPLPGAKLYFYVNETTTPKDTYSDVDLAVANQWPVVADGSGRFTDDIFMDTDAYRIKLTDENDVQIWSKDDCNTFNGAASGNAFPFPGAVIEFYGTQGQLDGYGCLLVHHGRQQWPAKFRRYLYQGLYRCRQYRHGGRLEYPNR